ncbi:hypothetical protein [Inhella sp.]|uniref:hypothetical protein n=1 Tax=Inhella sp. TaxID=1921806 RepID=UPI0035B45628
MAATPFVQAHESCRALNLRAAQDWGEAVPCYCGASLSRVRASLPGTLKVVAACRMTWDQGPEKGRVLRPAVDALDLDRYDAHGNYPEGLVFLRGQVQLEGVVRFTDESASFSAPDQVREGGGRSVLANNYLYRSLYFTAEQEGQLKPPRPRPGEAWCQTRRATLRFTDFRIRIVDTDADGSTPGRVEVLRLGPLRPCKDAH